jgi:hypothetical protein
MPYNMSNKIDFPINYKNLMKILFFFYEILTTKHIYLFNNDLYSI